MWLIIYSFIGWVYESVLCSILDKKPVNRGFLTGPICPIYGCGALLVIWFFYGRVENVAALFILSAVLTCSLEYLTSYIMEQIFHNRWWNYSNRKFNINGRVCLAGAIIFGTLCTCLIKIIHPFLSNIIDTYLTNFWLTIITILLMILFTFDLTLTVVHILRMNVRLKVIQDEYTKLKQQFEVRKSKFLEKQEDFINDFEMKIKEKIEAFENSELYDKHLQKFIKLRKYQDKRLLRAFPKLTSRDYNEAMNKLREKFFLKLK